MKYNKTIQDVIDEWEICPCDVRHDINANCHDTDGECNKCFKNHNISQNEIIDYIINESKREIKENKIEIESNLNKIENLRSLIRDYQDYNNEAETKIKELEKLKGRD